MAIMMKMTAKQIEDKILNDLAKADTAYDKEMAYGMSFVLKGYCEARFFGETETMNEFAGYMKKYGIEIAA